MSHFLATAEFLHLTQAFLLSALFSIYVSLSCFIVLLAVFKIYNICDNYSNFCTCSIHAMPIN